MDGNVNQASYQAAAAGSTEKEETSVQNATITNDQKKTTQAGFSELKKITVGPGTYHHPFPCKPGTNG